MNAFNCIQDHEPTTEDLVRDLYNDLVKQVQEVKDHKRFTLSPVHQSYLDGQIDILTEVGQRLSRILYQPPRM